MSQDTCNSCSKFNLNCILKISTISIICIVLCTALVYGEYRITMWGVIDSGSISPVLLVLMTWIVSLITFLFIIAIYFTTITFILKKENNKTIVINHNQQDQNTIVLNFVDA